MTSPIGHNSESATILRNAIARIEACRKRKKEAAEDEKAIYAELKAKGFDTPAVRKTVRAREIPPDQLREQLDLFDVYMHAMGMAEEPAIYKQLDLLRADPTSRASVVEALKKFVPEKGEIVVKDQHGKPIRLWRDKDGKVQQEDYVEPGSAEASAKKSTLPPRATESVPDCSESAAERMGEDARRENRPITDNPFPFGDVRQDRYERGWHNARPTDDAPPSDDDSDE